MVSSAKAGRSKLFITKPSLNPRIIKKAEITQPFGIINQLVMEFKV